mgnify:CR=1 FL=1
MAWSDIPGALTEDFIKEGFVVKTRSSSLCSLVGSSWICVRLNSAMVSTRCCCTDLSWTLGSLETVKVYQSISGQLKSPHKMRCFGLEEFKSFNESMSLLISDMFLFGI